MKQIQLFISQDISQDLLTAQVKKIFKIKFIPDLLTFDLANYTTTFGFLCSCQFFKKHEDFFKKKEIDKGTVILLYKQEGSLDLKANSKIFNLIKCDRKDIIEYGLINFYDSLEMKRDYKKKCDLNEKLLSIGVELSAEKDTKKLLSDILYKIRLMTKADAGSIYFVEEENEQKRNLIFKLSQNFSSKRDFTEFKMVLNKESLAGYVASTGEVLNISDVYNIPKKYVYSFNREYDIKTKYRTKSILTVPMEDHKNKIIGVVQLINKRINENKSLNSVADIEDNVVSFDKDDERIVKSLASQAAVSLENNILYNDIEDLFQSFVKASVKAIESRDPATSGHSNRVASYSVEIARAINNDETDILKDVNFSEEQIKEIKYAGLLHDFGKVGVREYILGKEKKLYPEHLEIIKLRLAYIKKCYKIEFLKHKDENRYKKEIDEVDELLKIILFLNDSSADTNNRKDKLKKYLDKKYIDVDGIETYWLCDKEIECLSIQRGNLTEAERKVIESHVEYSTSFLNSIPWIQSLKNIPGIVRGHHERLDGSGYPDGITAKDICIQTRILSVADFFDALVSSDRPYKRAIPLQGALKIVRDEVQLFHLDKDIVEIFFKKVITKKQGE